MKLVIPSKDDNDPQVRDGYQASLDPGRCHARPPETPLCDHHYRWAFADGAGRATGFLNPSSF